MILRYHPKSRSYLKIFFFIFGTENKKGFNTFLSIKYTHISHNTLKGLTTKHSLSKLRKELWQIMSVPFILVADIIKVEQHTEITSRFIRMDTGHFISDEIVCFPMGLEQQLHVSSFEDGFWGV